MQPLCCFEDKDGTRNKFFSLLLKHCWSDYFSNKIACDPALDSGDEAHESGSQDEEDSVDVSTNADDNSEQSILVHITFKIDTGRKALL